MDQNPVRIIRRTQYIAVRNIMPNALKEMKRMTTAIMMDVKFGVLLSVEKKFMAEGR